jgi:hypothetical protein
MLGSLDFIYAPSTDVAADANMFVDALGAELVLAIDDSTNRSIPAAGSRSISGAPETDESPVGRWSTLHRS